MRIFITGGAGFVGSHMADRLVRDGHTFTAYDNLSLGRRDFLASHIASGRGRLVEADLLDLDRLIAEMAGHDLVIHLAANSDIVRGTQDTTVDLRQGTLATYNTLEAMRRNGLTRILFASSSVIYGEASVIPTPEDYGPLFPISYYGASKLAGEAMITAFGHNSNIQCWIYRFGNIVGPHATHGVIYDFIHKLQANPHRLEILGDGRQAKPYLHVSDCVDGMLYGLAHAADPINYFNLAVDGATDVATIGQTVIREMGLRDVEVVYTGGARGWKGDVPRVGLSPQKLSRLGWSASMTSRQALERAVREIVAELTSGSARQ